MDPLGDPPVKNPGSRVCDARLSDFGDNSHPFRLTVKLGLLSVVSYTRRIVVAGVNAVKRLRATGSVRAEWVPNGFCTERDGTRVGDDPLCVTISISVRRKIKKKSQRARTHAHAKRRARCIAKPVRAGKDSAAGIRAYGRGAVVHVVPGVPGRGGGGR